MTWLDTIMWTTLAVDGIASLGLGAIILWEIGSKKRRLRAKVHEQLAREFNQKGE